MSNANNLNKNRMRFFLSAFLLILAVGVWSIYLLKDDTPTAGENSRALIGGPFSLTNHLNQHVTDKDFLGKYMLVYFGYTYCPDICPMDLQIMSDALEMLDPEIVNQINPVFVSVDPERDTVDIMAEYVKYFHDDLIGLTGTVEQIDAIKAEYRVYAAKADDTEDYIVDHTSFTYLMGKDGNLVTHFRHAEDPEKMAARITSLIE
ncbi:SCO family protein [Pseudemcibacter aquimaris]|uniref:SCO family protein n=1 Tax=Pseudemcibacter aquimaris TaxID=2857064 RepID=UPI002012BCF5|nr:SCO family protein [Pseudemcibacter aquimaris]MCC3861660.1 SCO family protein [Pseudemcibacter aquimaris]WDU58431.1 SCO family protein [Pseudemcibacter aquimaris]